MMSNKPIRLMTETFDLDDEGVMFLKSLSNKKLCVLSIIGPMHSGKSFLANQFVHRNLNSFEIGSIANTNETLTKGIWIYNAPIANKNKENPIVILDVEGMCVDSDDKDMMNYSKKLFTMITMISSLMIYNIKKDDDDSETIDETFITKMLKMFNEHSEGISNVKLNDDGGEITNISDVMFIARDFNDANIDMKMFNSVYDKVINDSNVYKTKFRNKISMRTLPLPMEENEMIINSYLDVDSEEEITMLPEFKLKMKSLEDEIIKSISMIKFNNISLDGDLYYSVLQEMASAFMCDEYPIIKNVIDNSIYAAMNEICDNVKDNFREKFDEVSYSKFNEYVKQCMNIAVKGEKCIELYSKSYIGKENHYEYIVSQIGDDVNVITDEILTKINDDISNYSSSLAALIKNDSEDAKPSSSDISTQFKSMISKLKEDFDSTLFPSSIDTSLLVLFPFLSDIKSYMKTNVISPLDSYIDIISQSLLLASSNLEDQLKAKDALLSAKLSELQMKDNEIVQCKIRIDDLTRLQEQREKEYNNNIDIERNKAAKKEEHYKAMLDIKDAAIKELEAKIDMINIDLARAIKESNEKSDSLRRTQQEFIEFKTKSEDTDTDSTLTSVNSNMLAAAFQKFRKVLYDYNDMAMKLDLNKSVVFHEKFIEKSILLLDDKVKSEFDELRNFKDERIKTMMQSMEKEIKDLKEENNKLLLDLNKANNSLKEKVNEALCEKIKAEDAKKNYEEFKKIIDKQNVLIKTKKDTMQFYVDKIDEQNKRIENLEMYLSKMVSKAKFAEDEIDMALTLVMYMVDGDKQKYQRNCNKVSNKSKEKLDTIKKKIGKV